MPRVLGGSQGGGRFLIGEVPLYVISRGVPARRTFGQRFSEIEQHQCSNEAGGQPAMPGSAHMLSLADIEGRHFGN